ncbi:MAG: MoaD/ThiS family protein [Deltaproteobacteria bacterium]|nr:MoaD/ThiS family protein [Deltaproteobacteria bacterium]
MHVIIDGIPEEIEAGLSLGQLIEERGEDSHDLIVELNHCHILRHNLAAAIIQEGDEVEIIHPAFGG